MSDNPLANPCWYELSRIRELEAEAAAMRLGITNIADDRNDVIVKENIAHGLLESSTAGRDLLERLEKAEMALAAKDAVYRAAGADVHALLELLSRYESALKFYADPNHVPDGPTLDVCQEYCRLANEALDGKDATHE